MTAKQPVGQVSESVARAREYDSRKGFGGLRQSLSSGRAFARPVGLIYPTSLSFVDHDALDTARVSHLQDICRVVEITPARKVKTRGMTNAAEPRVPFVAHE